MSHSLVCLRFNVTVEIYLSTKAWSIKLNIIIDQHEPMNITVNNLW